MSKAFTSESDDEETFISLPPLPPGTRNYITPAGARTLAGEQERLILEREALAKGDFEQERRRKAINRRLEFLAARLDAAQIIDPAHQSRDQVRFGAHVTLQSNDGALQTWRIVGLDEIDLKNNSISWMSPLATTLLEKKVGERVAFQGKPLTVTKITYL